jgi:hypothetical protein
MSAEFWQALKASVNQMETMLAGMKDMTTTAGFEAPDETIRQAEAQLAELKRMVVN